MSLPRVSPLIFLLVALALGATPAASRCKPVEAGPCVLDLHGEGAPRAAAICGNEAWEPHLSFDLPERFADVDGNGWHETVIELNLDPGLGCGCVVFRIVFEGEPTGHSVNIGDSPTNDGHGGDAFSTLFDAELMLQGDDLTAFGSEKPQSQSDAQIFGLRDLPIEDGVLELEVCDQSLRFSIDGSTGEDGLGGFFNTYTSRDLLGIVAPPEDDEARATEPDASIHAAFHRVIHRRNGAPSQNRLGRGIRRVEISLNP